MGLNIPKVTLTINGVSLIENTLKNLQKLNPEKIILVVGFKKNLVIEEVKKLKYNIKSELGIFLNCANGKSIFGFCYIKIFTKKIFI